ncbi:MAG: S1 RNA-binding domain-containing protein [Phycisphaeraceae bacterium]|nr:S1 RNA-binding domain-containing protein [Phycisphaeraceae bacterium]
MNDPLHSANGRPRNEQDAELERQVNEALAGQDLEAMMAQAAPPPSQAPSPDGKEEKSGRHGKDDPLALEVKRGRIISVQGDDVFVELAGMPGKNQGVVPLTQFERTPRIGSIMDFVVQSYDESGGLAILSREGAVARATWDRMQRGTPVEARVTGTNKGGLELEIVGGIRAFMPASQIDFHHIDDLSTMMGQRLEAIVQEIDRKGRSVVLSRRQLLHQRREVNKKKLWETLEAGQVREGVVTKLMEFGAFVDLGGAEGLIHVSDMAYARVDKPDDVVKEGQKVTVKVLKLDAEKQRISLGLKQIQPDPWEKVSEHLKSGEQITGRVVRLAAFGAFIEVEPGVEGLAPLSELSWSRINRAEQAVKEGDMVRAAVLSVDVANRRISLSLRQAGGDPWVGAEHKYARHSLVHGTVQSTTEFGAFVQLEPGVEGLVHISELSNKRVHAVTDILKVGDQMQFRVLEIDEDQRKVKLSLKAVEEPAAEPTDEGKSAAPAAGAGKDPGKRVEAGKPKKKSKGLLKGGLE